MNIAEVALKNKSLIYFFIAVLLLGGVFAFDRMSKLEDPAITVKQALVVTVYPGASAHKVELEVTDELEKSIRSMGDLDHVESRSMDDLSMILVELKSTTKPADLQQKWDILRRKVSAARADLPQQAYTPVVYDDFGNVYGIFYVMTSNGIEGRELSDYAQLVKRTIEGVKGVNNVKLYGEQKPCVNVELQSERMAYLGIHPAEILLTLANQNKSVYSGYFNSNGNRLKLDVTDAIDSISNISNMLIRGREKEMLRIGSIAKVTEGVETPIRELVKYNDTTGVAISIAMESGENVIRLGERIEQKIAQLQKTVIPQGIEFKKVSFQPTLVNDSISVFMINLVESVLIVILVVMLSMGFRSGYIIGTNLLIVVLGSFLILYSFHGTLQRVSLGSFIVAMGMLVDNAIVIIDGIMVDLRRGKPRSQALTQIAKQTAMPLLGATVIAILTFLPIFLSPDTTGEYVRDLFIVLAVSLLLSWVLALVYCPIQAERSIKTGGKEISDDEVYNKPLYCKFRGVLTKALDHRYIMLFIVVGTLAASIVGFRFIKQGFFPDLSYSQLYIEYKLPYNNSSEVVMNDLDSISDYLLSRGDISNVTQSLGGTPSRYNLVRTVPEPQINYGELIVDFKSPEQLKSSFMEIQDYLTAKYPDAFVRLKKYNLMYKDFPVQFQISGPDPAVLRDLCAQVEDIMNKCPKARLVTNNWSNVLPILSVNYNQQLARPLSMSRSDVGVALLAATDGLPVGTFYNGTHAMPIYLKSRDNKGNVIEDLNNVPVWSNLPNTDELNVDNIKDVVTGQKKAGEIIAKMVASKPLNAIAPNVTMDWRTPIVRRYDGQRALAAQCNVVEGYTASQVRDALLPEINKLNIPDGYSTMWQGEYQASQRSMSYLFNNLPLALILTVAILIALFKGYRRPLLIILCLPMALTGVVLAMLLSGKEFGFVAIVGMLGLIGMMIKNGVVLLNELDAQIDSGKEPYSAILDATSSRLRPVILAALTTILGMLPLVTDDMFGSLAVTIMGGLFVGTSITLIFLPVLYALFFKIKKQPSK